MRKLRLAVLISGRGSNLQSLIKACADPEFPAEIALVLSNKTDASGLEKAAKAGIATAIVSHTGFPNRADFDAEIDTVIRAHHPDLVCLAGFMRLLGATFVEAWHDRLINIHPALLPSFKGANAIGDALAAGVKVTGCTLHFVRAAMDSGPIIAQTAVPVHPGDDEAQLSARIRQAEHEIYPRAVRLIAEGRVRVIDEKTEIDDPK